MPKPTREGVMTWAIFLSSGLLLTFAQFITLPKSTDVLLGHNARFSCEGMSSCDGLVYCQGGSLYDGMSFGFGISWTVDNKPPNGCHREFSKVMDGVTQSTLTIPGSMENNNRSIRCWLKERPTSVPVSSAPVFLTVLGIGPVSSIEFVDAAHCPCTCIQWKGPSFINVQVPFDNKDLKYHISVSGADLSVLSVTTGKTNYCLKTTPLQEYTITVTPFSTSLGYVGPSHTATDSID